MPGTGRSSTRGDGRRVTPRRADRRSKGQATVELALVLPIVVLALLLVVQVGLVARDQVLVVAAARAGARAAAVDPSPGVADRAARGTPGLEGARLVILQQTQGAEGEEMVRVVVSYRAPTRVPVAGLLLGDPTLRAEATMAIERPAPDG